MKIGIITLYFKNYNFGGMLQAYALQKIIQDFGVDCRQIKYIYSCDTLNQKIKNKLFQKGLLRFIVFLLSKVACALCSKLLSPNLKKRKAAFIDFQENIVQHTNNIYTQLNIKETTTFFDVFICGSDQVWNLNLHIDTSFFLDFVPPAKKKIAYAPSISMDALSEEQQLFFKKHLAVFNAISVREKHGKVLLANIINDKEIHHVLDPTLLLKQEDWDLICPPVTLNKKYILCYILGDSRKQRKIVKQISKSLSLPILTFPYILGQFRFSDLGFGDIKSYEDGPAGFISLIKNAEFVFTDSFHACALSAIYHKKFFAFKRFKDDDKSSMNSRIYSLMDLLSTRDRILEDDIDPKTLDIEAEIDYLASEQNLCEQREYSIKFLRKAIFEESDNNT